MAQTPRNAGNLIHPREVAGSTSLAFDATFQDLDIDSVSRIFNASLPRGKARCGHSVAVRTTSLLPLATGVLVGGHFRLLSRDVRCLVGAFGQCRCKGLSVCRNAGMVRCIAPLQRREASLAMIAATPRLCRLDGRWARFHWTTSSGLHTAASALRPSASTIGCSCQQLAPAVRRTQARIQIAGAYKREKRPLARERTNASASR
ncbi:hypothetical protein C8Q73DRAFT_88626 [Cubamyces lactineus]|nr:hypothetical protein C8Q73DRAFT_88626 [Cubamyces lactineus]